MKAATRGPCPNEATHRWGKVNFCCGHFDLLVIALYDINEAVTGNRHQELVALYEQNARLLSRIRDKKCEEEPDKGGDR